MNAMSVNVTSVAYGGMSATYICNSAVARQRKMRHLSSGYVLFRQVGGLACGLRGRTAQPFAAGGDEVGIVNDEKRREAV